MSIQNDDLAKLDINPFGVRRSSIGTVQVQMGNCGFVEAHLFISESRTDELAWSRAGSV